jgi:hypothetical protein
MSAHKIGAAMRATLPWAAAEKTFEGAGGFPSADREVCPFEDKRTGAPRFCS